MTPPYDPRDVLLGCLLAAPALTVLISWWTFWKGRRRHGIS